MNQQLGRAAIPALRWSVGVVLLLQGCRFAFSGRAAHAFANSGLPPWIPPSLGGTEALAALLLLVPATRMAGGYSVLVILFVAIAIHILHRWYDVGALVVYGVAVFVCLTQRKTARIESGT
jgi:hypothetical protein